MSAKSLLAAAAAVMLWVPAAHAGWIGDNVGVDYVTGTTLVSSSTAQAVPFTGALSGSDYSVGATQISITVASTTTFATNATFNGLVFTDTSRNPDIIGVTLDSGTAVAGGTPAFSFTSNSVSVDLSGVTLTSGNAVTVDLSFGTIPEPATLGLLGVGAVAIGFVQRRRGPFALKA